MEKFLQADLDELRRILTGIDPIQVAVFRDALTQHARVFAVGRGRSGMVMSMFAMRLMQIGLDVHVIGEATTPAVRPGDLLVIGSGSGITEACLTAAREARSLGATVASLSAVADSPIISLSDIVVLLPGQTKRAASETGTRMLAGTSFEQSLLIFCDCTCAELAEARGITSELIMELHANIE